MSAECASERILKIGQYVAKIWTILKWDVFLRHSVDGPGLIMPMGHSCKHFMNPGGFCHRAITSMEN